MIKADFEIGSPVALPWELATVISFREGDEWVGARVVWVRESLDNPPIVYGLLKL